MFLRRHRKHVAGESYEYWTLCESRRTAAGPRQKVVATLGKLTGEEPLEEAGWEQLESLLDGKPAAPRQMQLGQSPASALEGPRWEVVDVRGVRVERSRDFGEAFLGLALWRRLGLHALLAELIEPGEEEVPWPTVASVLTVARFCGQRSELGIAERWYAHSAMEDLLGVPWEKINDDRLYRGLDVLAAHKDKLCAHLMERYHSWFGVAFEFLLYDVTSTFFEGQAEKNEKAARGYSRDSRPDCKQVCIGLVCTPEGLPLSYEVFAGNRTDVTTVEEIVRAMEEKYGKAQRVWVMDRGMVSEENIEFLRQRGARYLVGTPKSQLRQFEAELLEREGWSEVQSGLEAKLVAHPDGQGQEQFILCRSSARGQKEAAMLVRQSDALCEELARIYEQAGETLRQRWSWVEPAVWTERMLTALERGVKGGQWFSLIDKVYDVRNLRSAFCRVWQNDGSAGMDGQSVSGFEHQLEAQLARLAEEVRTQTYRPQPVRRVYLPKPGSCEKRPLGIPAVRDRGSPIYLPPLVPGAAASVVQGALRHVIEPIFEREFAAQSYGFRPGRGCKDALRRVEQLLQSGHTWVVDADLKSYFDSIPHERLMACVAGRIADGRVLALIESYLKAGVLEAMKGWEPTESGTPQGAVISPLLANLYLNALDHGIAAAGFEMVRYADDFVILCQSQAQAQQALALVQAWVREAGLQLHPEKTRLVDATERGGFEFLGYHFERGMKWPRQKSVAKLKERLRPLTRRTQGYSLEVVIARLNPILRGWFGYFAQAKANTFSSLDSWVRGRLRSILRKRQKRRGRGRGRDHQRWPNAYFGSAGLYSLEAAWQELRRSHV